MVCFLMPSVVSINAISPIHRCGVKFLLIGKLPMTSKSHMLHGVNNLCMVICNQSAKFHDCTLSRLFEPVYTFNNILIRIPEFSCSIKGHCTPIRKYASLFYT